MALSNPFQTVLEGLLEDLFSKKGINSPFSQQIRRMQSDIEGQIQGRGGIEAFQSMVNTGETAPVFAPQPKSRPDPNNPPAISDPRFRPDIPTDPLAIPEHASAPRSAPTKLAQAGPETMTNAPPVKPLQAGSDLVNAVITQESGGDPNALSPKGAIGLMQIMPATATDPGFGIAPIPVDKLTNAAANKKFGTDYLSAMLNRYNGDTRRALIAFNAGHTVADKFTGDLSSLPAETQNYVSRIEATLGLREAEALSAPGNPPGAALGVPVPATGAQEPVAPQAPSVRRARPQHPKPVTAPSLPPIDLGPPGMAQTTPRRPIVPVLWTQFLKSRNPKDLASVPKSGLPAILALMGQTARRRPS